MDIRNRRELKAAADQSLKHAAYDPKKLVLIYTGVTLAVSLVSLVLDYILNQQISGTGGLSGIGTRSMLETVQSLVTLAQLVVLPFWQCGWIYTTVQLYRRQQVGPTSLLQGFRKFGPVLRLQLLLFAIYYAVSMAIVLLVVILVFATAAGTLMGNADILAAGTQMQMTLAVWPVVIIACVVICVVVAFFSYRLRLSWYCVMDHPEEGAVAAIKNSWVWTKKNVFALFKLDLSFLWFSLLDGLVAVILYLDMLLPMLGIELPVSAQVSYFGAFALYAVCQLALYRWRKDYVDVTYAAAYDALQQREEQPLRTENEETAAG